MLKKLQDYCECVNDIDQRDIDELINLISTMTCWKKNIDDTFLNSERKEIADLRVGYFTFTPFYQPYDVDSFKFTLVKIDGIKEEKTILEKDTDYIFSDVENCFKFDIDINNTCGEKFDYKLLIEYTAGYEDIPDFLLPVMCNLINVIKAKNTCDCENCESCNNKTENPNARVNYSKGDILTVALENELGELLQKNYMAELSMLSLCPNENDFWGKVL